jgi:pimeloyl-ACP methyl ester carboxylesterase
MGCLRLDDNLFNPSTDITEYRLDEYDGRVEFEIGDSFPIADSMVHLFSLQSQAPEEESSTTIRVLYVGDLSRIATDTVILYCHGNGAHLDAYWPRIKLLAYAGGLHHYGVMAMDYRGYGLSAGKPSEAGLYADVDACMQWLQDRGLTSDRLVAYGYSMGSAPATELTAHPRSLEPHWLIHESPFASAAVMVQDGASLNMPGSFYTNLEINNADEIRLVTHPFLLFHGEEDDFLRISTHGEVVFRNYNGVHGQFVRVPGADHGEIPPTLGFASYRQMIDDHIRWRP